LPLVAVACILLLFVSGCAADKQAGFGGIPDLAVVFEERYGDSVILKHNVHGCAVMVSARSDGDWLLCDIGTDFVRFCAAGTDAEITYPLGSLCLSTGYSD